MDNLDLIDWRMLLFAALWISGLALLLSASGFAVYSANQTGQRVRKLLGSPRYQSWLNFGLALFCVGLLGSARACWEMILWGLLGAAFLVYAVAAWRSIRKAGKDFVASEPEQSPDNEQPIASR